MTKGDAKRSHTTTGDTTTSQRMRDFCGGGKINGGGNGDGVSDRKCRVPPSRDLTATALVLAAEAAAALIAE